jgi:hypothetical protein
MSEYFAALCSKEKDFSALIILMHAPLNKVPERHSAYSKQHKANTFSGLLLQGSFLAFTIYSLKRNYKDKGWNGRTER